MTDRSGGPAIEAVQLSRSYRNRSGIVRRRVSEIEAVREVSFTVERGELFGLLGPNGAGKTTTIKMLNTLLLPSSGQARVLGYDCADQAVEVRRRIGYIPGGDKGMYDRLSGYDNLRYFAELYGVDPAEQRSRIRELLEQVGLSGRENERVEGYSRGMRQRLHIARGLLHRPAVLFLDEPSLGLDPVAARQLRETVAGLRREGVTILLTTHYMAEADELCDRIAVIDRGGIRALGTPEEIKGAEAAGTVLEAAVDGDVQGRLDTVRQLPGVSHVALESDTGRGQLLVIQAAADAVDLYYEVAAALRGLPVTRLASRQPTLEDAYVAIVGGLRPGMVGEVAR
ncbi:ATP-binding cassette domain-containing protein [Streptomyces sp. NPDC004230]